MAVDPDRRRVKEALRGAGLSDRQVRALFTKGWAGLVGERDAELAAALEKLEEMTSAMNRIARQ